MNTQKITTIFAFLLLFTFSNCCKKEAVKEEKTTTENQIIEQTEITSEVLNPDAYAKRMDVEKVQLVDILKPFRFSGNQRFYFLNH